MTKVIILVVIAYAASTASSQVGIFTIGTLQGGSGSAASGVSSDGTYMVGRSFEGFGNSIPILWTRENGLSSIPFPTNGFSSDAGTVAHNGMIITGRYSLNNGLGPAGFIWSQNTGPIQLESLPGGNLLTTIGFVGTHTDFAIGSSTYGVNDFGAQLSRAVKWSFAEGLEALPLPTPEDANGNSFAGSILSDGRIFLSVPSGSWLWSETTGFEFLPGAEGLRHISADGRFMSGTLNRQDILADGAVYWTRESGPVFLPLTNPNSLSRVIGMSADGSIIIGSQGTTQVIWIDQGLPVSIGEYAESLGIDMTGWTILSVLDISDDGSTIVGQARINGRNEGFVLTIPGPGGAVAVPVALAFLRRRR